MRSRLCRIGTLAVSPCGEIKGSRARAVRFDKDLYRANIDWLDVAITMFIGHFGGAEAIPASGPQGRSFPWPEPTKPDGNPRLLNRPWQKGDIVHLVMSALITEGAPTHQAREEIQPLIEHPGTLFHIGDFAKVTILCITQAS